MQPIYTSDDEFVFIYQRRTPEMIRKRIEATRAPWEIHRDLVRAGLAERVARKAKPKRGR